MLTTSLIRFLSNGRQLHAVFFFAVLLVYLPICLGQETAKGPLRSLSHKESKHGADCEPLARSDNYGNGNFAHFHKTNVFWQKKCIS